MKKILVSVCILLIVLWGKAELRDLFYSISEETKMIIGIGYLLGILMFPLAIWFKTRPKWL